MKAPSFSYARPTTIAQTLALLGEYRDDARVLAGGQSLGPMLNLRLIYPRVLIDINGIAELSGVSLAGNCLRIGALTRHVELERSPDIALHLPLVASAMPYIAHPAIRNRGTFGGSCAHADPAAELPACALALSASFIVVGQAGERRVPANDFFRGVFATALGSDELLVAAEFPIAKKGYASAFGELARRRGDYAMVGVAVHGAITAKRFSDLRIALFSLGDRPSRATTLEQELQDKPATAAVIEKSLTALDPDLDPRADLQSSRQGKLHLARVVVGRVLKQFADL